MMGRTEKFWDMCLAYIRGDVAAHKGCKKKNHKRDERLMCFYHTLSTRCDQGNCSRLENKIHQYCPGCDVEYAPNIVELHRDTKMDIYKSEGGCLCSFNKKGNFKIRGICKDCIGKLEQLYKNESYRRDYISDILDNLLPVAEVKNLCVNDFMERQPSKCWHCFYGETGWWPQTIMLKYIPRYERCKKE